jgi:hypothetical protein
MCIYIYTYCVRYMHTKKNRRAGAEVSETKQTNYNKSMAYRKVSEMQKQWSVEVMRCINEWANDAWDAAEMTWKKLRTTDWMNQYTNESMIQSMNAWTLNHWINDSINQQTIETINQAANELQYQSTNQWVNEGVSESMNQWVNDSVKQWSSQSLNPWTDDSAIQCINEPMNQWSSEAMSRRFNEPMIQWILKNQWVKRINEPMNR